MSADNGKPSKYRVPLKAARRSASPGDANRLGQQAEQLAAAYLAQYGLTLLEQNYRCPRGEIDLIMLDQGTVVFVEVKFRSSDHYGAHLDYVDHRKQQKLRLTANAYLTRHPRHQNLPCRFDVIGIAPTPDSFEVNWLKNALDTNY